MFVKNAEKIEKNLDETRLLKTAQIYQRLKGWFVWCCDVIKGTQIGHAAR